MRHRWILAVAGALGLALLTQDAPLPSLSSLWAGADASSPFSCPADAKPAKLDFTLKNADGRSVTLAEHKGEVILLDFWATWCGPCKFEIPGLVDLQSRYGQAGLQVIGVSVDDTAKQIEPFAAEYKMNYPVLLGLGHDDLMDAYGPIWGIPVSILISRDGRICATHPGITAKETFEREIKALL
jgi:peroxiredoxin